jgi:hypothetical protein
MKRLLLSLALLGGATTASLAQTLPLPNGGFETWAGTPEKPQHWQTTDDILQAVFQLPLPVTSTAVTRSADAAGGSSALRLETQPHVVMGVPMVFPGMVILGDRLREHPTTEGGGLPFSGRPAALQCRYKLTGQNLAADSAYVGVLLTRRVGVQTVVVAEGVVFLRQAAPSYTLLQVPLQYTSSLAPDSIHILAASADPTIDNMTPGNVLQLDDFATVGTVTAARETQPLSAALTAYPNPSPDGRFTLDAGPDAALTGAPLTVADALGRPVLSLPATGRSGPRPLDLRGQPAGVYTLQLRSAQGVATRRLIIR